MTSIAFKPIGTHVTVKFPLEDADSQPQNGSTARLTWKIAVKGPGTVRLSAGGTLNEMEGRLFVAVGDADASGKVLLEGMDTPCWGALWYFKSESAFNVNVYVSRELFGRLLRLIELCRLPDIELQFPLDSPIRSRGVPSFTHWNNTDHERGIFSHCVFQVEFPTVT